MPLKNDLRQAGACACCQTDAGQGVDRRRKRRIGDAAIGGQTDGGEIGGARRSQIGVGGGEIGFGRHDIGTPGQERGRESRRHRRRHQPAKAFTGHGEALWRAAQQDGQRIARLQGLLFQGGYLRLLRRQRSPLLDEIGTGRIARRHPPLDHAKYVFRGFEIGASHRQAFAQRQKLEVGRGNTRCDAQGHGGAVGLAGAKLGFGGIQ